MKKELLKESIVNGNLSKVNNDQKYNNTNSNEIEYKKVLNLTKNMLKTYNKDKSYVQKLILKQEYRNGNSKNNEHNRIKLINEFHKKQKNKDSSSVSVSMNKISKNDISENKSEFDSNETNNNGNNINNKSQLNKPKKISNSLNYNKIHPDESNKKANHIYYKFGKNESSLMEISLNSSNYNENYDYGLVDQNQKNRNVKDESMEKLKFLFNYYNQYSLKNNSNTIKLLQLIKLFKDANLIDNYLSKNDLEIVYSNMISTKRKKIQTSNNKNNSLNVNIDFKVFLEFIFLSSLRKFENYMKSDGNLGLNKLDNKFSSSKELLKSMVNNNLFNLHDSIISQNQISKNQNQSFKQSSNSNSNTNTNSNLNNLKKGNMNMDEHNKFDLVDYKNLSIYSKKVIKKDYNHNKYQLTTKMENVNLNTDNRTGELLSLSESIKRDVINLDLLNQNSYLLALKLKESKCDKILKQILPILFEIFIVYFNVNSDKNNIENIRRNMKQNFQRFLQDFEIYPNLINQKNLTYIFNKCFNSEINKELVDFLFKNMNEKLLKKIMSLSSNINKEHSLFFSFIECFLRCCEITFLPLVIENKSIKDLLNDNNKDNIVSYLSNMEIIDKICLTIEKMEVSEGIELYRKKCNLTSNIQNSSFFEYKYEFKSKNILEKIFDEIIKDKQIFIKTADNSILFNLNARNSIVSPGNNILPNNKCFIINNFDYIFKEYGNELKTIFEYYCSYGDNENYSLLKSTKFYKLLKDANVIRFSKLDITDEGFLLSPNEVDSIYKKVLSTIDSLILNDKISKKDNRRSMDYSINENESMVHSTEFNNNDYHVDKINKKMRFSLDKKKISNTNHLNYMNFDAFITSIEILGKRLYPNHGNKEAIDTFITTCILPLKHKFNRENLIDKTYQIFNEERENNSEYVSFFY